MSKNFANMLKSKITSIPTFLIAPCGLNCRLCRAYIRKRKPCPGCRGSDVTKSASCAGCKIKNCPELQSKKYCFSCKRFPCSYFTPLDKRYRTKYGLSVVQNLGDIQEGGVRKFIRREKQKWRCPECGGLLCMHDVKCPNCQFLWKI